MSPEHSNPDPILPSMLRQAVDELPSAETYAGAEWSCDVFDRGDGVKKISFERVVPENKPPREGWIVPPGTEEPSPPPPYWRFTGSFQLEDFEYPHLADCKSKAGKERALEWLQSQLGPKFQRARVLGDYDRDRKAIPIRAEFRENQSSPGLTNP
jgi:hypothetical protein